MHDEEKYETFLNLPIMIKDDEINAEGWRRPIMRQSTIRELLDTWNIDDETEQSEMAQVLRHLRTAILLQEPQPEPKQLLLEYGKRYINGQGTIKGPMRPTPHDNHLAYFYKFKCETSGDTYSESGLCDQTGTLDYGYQMNLVSEYVNAFKVGDRIEYIGPAIQPGQNPEDHPSFYTNYEVMKVDGPCWLAPEIIYAQIVCQEKEHPTVFCAGYHPLSIKNWKIIPDLEAENRNNP